MLCEGLPTVRVFCTMSPYADDRRAASKSPAGTPNKPPSTTTLKPGNNKAGPGSKTAHLMTTSQAVIGRNKARVAALCQPQSIITELRIPANTPLLILASDYSSGQELLGRPLQVQFAASLP